jgi:uncharacterized NAD(P)/FAD-binding protein YdhS/mannose-6-phosphate isomerase-like protein (cupin superfamily)
MTPALARLVASLEAAGELGNEALASALSEPIGVDDVAPWVRFDHNNYRRNLVAKRANFELRVLCWLPKQRTSLHGHDGSACAFRILQGTSTEIRLRQSDRHWSPGTVVTEGGANLVHQVTNLGDTPLVSLHAYAPALPIDQPPPTYGGRQIVIIGGGVAGVALAIHLLRGTRDDVRVAIVERRQWLGRGPAYGTTDPAMRLNVPADRMSLFPSAGGDFVEWASRQGARVPDTALLPRQLFGEYVEDRLATTITDSRGKGKIWCYRAEAVEASARGVQLADGVFLPADAVVLATGNQLPSAPAALSGQLLRSNRIIGDPWSGNALAAIDRHEDVLLIGTGLTAVDVLVTLRARNHHGRVLALSRHGLLPAAHLRPDDPLRRPVTIDPTRLPTGARQLSRWLRVEARRLDVERIGWQCLVDALRPHTTRIWTSLPLAEKRRFMKHVRPYWEAVRHRADPDALAAIEAWRTAGDGLEVMAGAVMEASDADDGLHVEIAPRGSGTRLRSRFDRIVLCTGPETDVRRWTSQLFRNLLADGHLQADPLGIGVVTDDVGQVLGKAGASSWLYTIGSLRRPQLWETTAVPDIVKQAAALAQHLCSRES